MNLSRSFQMCANNSFQPPPSSASRTKRITSTVAASVSQQSDEPVRSSVVLPSRRKVETGGAAISTREVASLDEHLWLAQSTDGIVRFDAFETPEMLAAAIIGAAKSAQYNSFGKDEKRDAGADKRSDRYFTPKTATLMQHQQLVGPASPERAVREYLRSASHAEGTESPVVSSAAQKSANSVEPAVDSRVEERKFAPPPKRSLGRWIDIQTKRFGVISSILQMFGIDEVQTTKIVEGGKSIDMFVYVPRAMFSYCNLVCTGANSKISSLDNGFNNVNETGSNDEEDVGNNGVRNVSAESLIKPQVSNQKQLVLRPLGVNEPLSADYTDSDKVFVTIIVFQDWIITAHDRPFCGLYEICERVQQTFGLLYRGVRHTRLQNMRACGTRTPLDGRGNADVGDLSTSPLDLFTPSWLFSNLLDCTLRMTLPDKLYYTAQADRLNELCFTLSGRHDDQRDYVRSMANLGQLISKEVRLVIQKELLLRQLLSTSGRSSAWVNSDGSRSAHYLQIQRGVSDAAQVLSRAREVLQSTNVVFTNALAVDLQRTANEVNSKLAILTFLYLLFIPLHVIGGLWGMNVRVPRQEDRYQDVIFLFVLLGLSLWWFTVLSENLKRYVNLYKRAEEEINSKRKENLI